MQLFSGGSKFTFNHRSLSWNTAFITIIILAISACTSSSTPTSESQPQPTDTDSGTEAEMPATETPIEAIEVLQIPDGIIQVPVPEFAYETADYLRNGEHPPRDYYLSAVQILGMSEEDLRPAPPRTTPLRINDRENFIYRHNLTSRDDRLTPARLRYISENAYWWTGANTTITDEEIVSGAERFESIALPTNRLVFGKEWSPGIDGDQKIHFLILEIEEWGGVFGYFSRIHEFPNSLEKNSNEREMLFINASAFPFDSDSFLGKLAHEYQHLIQWNRDANEELWLNEAFSELAYFLTGSPIIEPGGGSYSNAEYFALNPDIQLTARPERRYGDDDKSAFMHYGAERAFIVYLLEQFGPEFIKNLVYNEEPGVLSIQQEMAKLDPAPNFDDVYANWLLANLLNQSNIAGGIWGYRELKPYLPFREVVQSFRGQPIVDQLLPYGAHYYEIQTNEEVHATFKGATVARLTPVDPVSGQYAWYSNRGDSSVFSLTRAFDLSDLSKATLNYKVWYELEEYYDFAYLEISTDNGETWTILETQNGSDLDPFEYAYGFNYSGASLDWKTESIDLSDYAGQEVLVRFEVYTDFSTNRDGFMLDDIEIPELGYFDGAEDDSGGWEARGFIRSSNFVPTNWIVWLIELTRPTSVTRIELNELSQAEFTFQADTASFPYAAIVISPAAPVTTLELDYELVLEHTE